MIARSRLVESVRQALSRSRVVSLLGPRQCGKTTVGRQLLAANSPNYFDLEDPASLARLDEPMTALRELKDLIVIDEVQRRPELFPVLRVLVDRVPLPARFLILGSASPALLRQSSESLAGRIALIPMNGFSLEEVGVAAQLRHWLRGGFPLSYLAEDDPRSSLWRADFIRTFLERDLTHQGARSTGPVKDGRMLGVEVQGSTYPSHTFTRDRPGRSEAERDRGGLPGAKRLPPGKNGSRRCRSMLWSTGRRGCSGLANSTQSLRTSMETVDTGGSGGQENGRRFRKSLKRRPRNFPS